MAIPTWYVVYLPSLQKLQSTIPHLLCQLKIALNHSVRNTKNDREKLFTVSRWRTNLVAVDEIFQDFVERMAHV
jgi:hypothetical protein